jgi:glucokinase
MANESESATGKLVGVDIGGTKISAGLVENGRILMTKTVPTPQQGKASVIDALTELVKVLWQDDVIGIGMGVPGMVDTHNGIVYDVQNIPLFQQVPLKSALEKVFHVPVAVNNDANCFALGAKNFGKGTEFHNLVGLTLGTGLGGGIVVHDRLHEGMGCGAGEFGFVPYRDGILEHYCSGQFFQRQYQMKGEEVAALAHQGNARAKSIFAEFGMHLGEAIKIVVHVFAPEAVMLGGSISRDFVLFEASMWENIRLFPYSHVVDQLRIFPATQPDIALVGAASLVYNDIQHQQVAD